MLFHKICNKCKQEKPLFDFSEHPKGILGRQTHCKSCVAENHRKYNYKKPCISCGKEKGEGIPQGAKLCLECSKVCFDCKKNPRMKQHRRCYECSRKRDNERNAKLRENPEKTLEFRINKTSSKYKISKEHAKVLSLTENCTCCNKYLPELKQRHVDHCHKTGKVRNVLCFNCNAALGHVNDSQEILQKLIDYLKKYS